MERCGYLYDRFGPAGPRSETHKTAKVYDFECSEVSTNERTSFLKAYLRLPNSKLMAAFSEVLMLNL